jgi:Mg-chelatase subunit ChlD
MNSLDKYNHSCPVPGSLKDISERTGKSIAEVLQEIEALVIVDTSGSMCSCDAGPNGDRERFEVAYEKLVELQSKYQGMIAIISFSDNAELCEDGHLKRFGGSTDMAAALEMALPLDGTCKIILISDGEPNSEDMTIQAAEYFENPIDTIYIGYPGEYGEKFLELLATKTKGKYQNNPQMADITLTENIARLLPAPKQMSIQL